MADGQAPAADAPAPATEGSTATAVQPSQIGGQQEAGVGMVTQTYTNYVSDIQNAVEALRQRAVALQTEAPAQLQQLQSQIEPQTLELVQTLQDTQQPISLSATHVVGLFGWSSILLLSTAITGLISGYILSPLMGIFVARLGAALLASVALPAAAAFYLNGADGSSSETRFHLLTLSLAQGSLLGYALSHSYTAGQPIAALTPLAIAFAYPLVAAQVGNAHTHLLGGVLGAAFGAQILVGFVLGLSFSYLVLAALYTAASGAVLQIAFKHLQAPNRVHMYQILLVASFLFSKALVYGVFGSSEPPK